MDYRHTTPVNDGTANAETQQRSGKFFLQRALNRVDGVAYEVHTATKAEIARLNSALRTEKTVENTKQVDVKYH